MSLTTERTASQKVMWQVLYTSTVVESYCKPLLFGGAVGSCSIPRNKQSPNSPGCHGRKYSEDMNCVYIEGLIMIRPRFIFHNYLCVATETDSVGKSVNKLYNQLTCYPQMMPSWSSLRFSFLNFSSCKTRK